MWIFDQRVEEVVFCYREKIVYVGDLIDSVVVVSSFMKRTTSFRYCCPLPHGRSYVRGSGSSNQKSDIVRV